MSSQDEPNKKNDQLLPLSSIDSDSTLAVSYTHLTLPTNREV